MRNLAWLMVLGLLVAACGDDTGGGSSGSSDDGSSDDGGTHDEEPSGARAYCGDHCVCIDDERAACIEECVDGQASAVGIAEDNDCGDEYRAYVKCLGQHGDLCEPDELADACADETDAVEAKCPA